MKRERRATTLRIRIITTITSTSSTPSNVVAIIDHLNLTWLPANNILVRDADNPDVFFPFLPLLRRIPQCTAELTVSSTAATTAKTRSARARNALFAHARKMWGAAKRSNDAKMKSSRQLISKCYIAVNETSALQFLHLLDSNQHEPNLPTSSTTKVTGIMFEEQRRHTSPHSALCNTELYPGHTYAAYRACPLLPI